MRNKHLPSEGQSIDVTLGDRGFAGSYITSVDQVSDEGLTVVCPVHEGAIVPIREGMLVSISYKRASALYSFETRVLKRLSGRVPLLLLEPPIELVRMQRREHVRITVHLPIGYAVVDPEHDITEPHPTEPADSMDICAGGMRLVPRIPPAGLVSGSVLRLEFSLSLSSGCLVAKGRVVRVEEGRGGSLRSVTRIPESARGVYRLAVEFVDVPEATQDLITRFVFERERELIRRGMAD